MEINSKQYEQHTFKSFLSKYQVTIPMVQRDYAQGRTSIDVNRVRNRFLTAIKSYLVQPKTNHKIMKMDFVYGEKENVWSKVEVGKLEKIIVTPLDGQQRLTTLYLLHWYAAKKASLQPTDYAFLEHFTYDIRPSSRDFCTHLLRFTPSFNSSIKEQLIDQYWFMGDWHNDPTILSMLVMLDAIMEKFSDVDNLWNLLTGDDERIVFFFLPLAENGLSDELYIKMNSRGKKLTPFEHFKAEYEALYEHDSEESMDINHKFDVEWADTLFSYRDDDDLTDKEFMRYFFYISHILCYQQSVKKSTDEFELIKTLYQESPKAVENRKFFENAMDCWYQVKNEFGSIGNFFSRYLSQFTHEKDKVATYKTVSEYHTNQNFFHACIKLYQVNNNFSYSDFLFLFGIIVYLTNRDKIEETAFIERLRILRNLIWNSNSGEIRGDSDYMSDLLTEVSELMLNGIIRTDLKHGFNGFQEKEEIEKQEKKSQMTNDDLERMYKYEDHPLVYGYVSGLGYDYLYLTDTFYSVFGGNDVTHCDLSSIAMVSSIPGIKHLVPSNLEEYFAMVDWSIKQDAEPVYITVPAGPVVHAPKDQQIRTDYSQLSWELVHEGSQVALIAVGDFFGIGQKTVEKLAAAGIDATLVKLLFASGLDTATLNALAQTHDVILTIEDGIVDGGFGQRVAGYLGTNSSTKVLVRGFERAFYDRFKASDLLEEARITPDKLTEDVLAVLNN